MLQPLRCRAAALPRTRKRTRSRDTSRFLCARARSSSLLRSSGCRARSRTPISRIERSIRALCSRGSVGSPSACSSRIGRLSTSSVGRFLGSRSASSRRRSLLRGWRTHAT
eukprot:Amastigsp_a842552_9.p7 type:complete len:111 gc:universal Amastigsp_a842552_9:2003-1671(-)